LDCQAIRVDQGKVTVLSQLPDCRLDFIEIDELLMSSCCGLGGLGEDVPSRIGPVAD
jgi:hypothetical protein